MLDTSLEISQYRIVDWPSKGRSLPEHLRRALTRLVLDIVLPVHRHVRYVETWISNRPLTEPLGLIFPDVFGGDDLSGWVSFPIGDYSVSIYRTFGILENRILYMWKYQISNCQYDVLRANFDMLKYEISNSGIFQFSTCRNIERRRNFWYQVSHNVELSITFRYAEISNFSRPGAGLDLPEPIG